MRPMLPQTSWFAVGRLGSSDMVAALTGAFAISVSALAFPLPFAFGFSVVFWFFCFFLRSKKLHSFFLQNQRIKNFLWIRLRDGVGFLVCPS